MLAIILASTSRTGATLRRISPSFASRWFLCCATSTWKSLVDLVIRMISLSQLSKC